MITMLNIFRTEAEKEHVIAAYNNPFQKDCVDSITIDIRKRAFLYGKKFSATIRMKNNKTSANHDIGADSFPELLQKIDEFINSL